MNTRFLDRNTVGLLLDLAYIVAGFALFVVWFAHMSGPAL